MSRRRRIATGGIVYHVLNRTIARATMFARASDYDAFVRILKETKERIPVRLLAYCVMPNHWHLVLWPRSDGALSEFMRVLTMTHVHRWHTVHETTGTGALYQGRFKSFPVMNGKYFFAVLRYVERNALRAGLVNSAQDWRWSSAWYRSDRSDANGLIDQGPERLPEDWIELLNRPQFNSEVRTLRQSLQRGSPYGSESWRNEVAAKLGLLSTLRNRGRPWPAPPDRSVKASDPFI